jgi:hypothetical protein
MTHLSCNSRYGIILWSFRFIFKLSIHISMSNSESHHAAAKDRQYASYKYATNARWAHGMEIWSSALGRGQLILNNFLVFFTMIVIGKSIIITQSIFSLNYFIQLNLTCLLHHLLFHLESGCLLPSLPSDATFDQYSGISFICDLNDNIPAPWPSTSQLSASCNKSMSNPSLLVCWMVLHLIIEVISSI